MAVVGRTSALAVLLALFCLCADAAQMKQSASEQELSGQASQNTETSSDRVGQSDSEEGDEDDDGDDATKAADDATKAADDAGESAKEQEGSTRNVRKGSAPLTPSGLAQKEDELEKAMSPHAPEEVRLRKAVATAKEELAANSLEQEELKDRVKYFSDETKAREEIDASIKLVANETESPAMASMIGHMWKEMRMFEVPSYTEHAEKDLRELENEQNKSEAKLQAADDKLNTAKERWAHGEVAKKEQDSQLAEMVKAMPKLDKASLDKPAAETSKWNFWKMNKTGQKSFLIYSLVYIVGGVCLAFMYYKARSRHPKIFSPEVRPDKFADSKEFGFPIFGCLGAPNICVMGFCCPCFRWADTMDQRGLLSYWKAFCAFFALTILHCYTWGISSLVVVSLGVFYRQKLRESHDIENGSASSVAMDVLMWLFCQPCAIVQEARESSIVRGSRPVASV